jgi:hypothetical protein
MVARWIARLLLVRSLWSELGSGGRQCLCGCLVLLVVVAVVALLFLGWFVCGIVDWC